MSYARLSGLAGDTSMARQQPLYRQYRTVRATMAATGQGFSAARETRRAALSRSQTGRAVLARETQRRERQRERREERRRGAPINILRRDTVPGLPPPDYNRDYGVGVPYAVVVRAHFTKGVRGAMGWTTVHEFRDVTLFFDHRPSAREVDREVSHMYETHTHNDRPMGDSDIDDTWEMVDHAVIGYYISRSAL
jgi:hypothetical protein